MILMIPMVPLVEDCPGTTSWDAPDTCQWMGVPVKEKSDPASLWCGTDYGDGRSII